MVSAPAPVRRCSAYPFTQIGELIVASTLNKIKIKVMGKVLTPSAQVSIIITCYNYAHFLPEAIESAISQTDSAYEIIVVNDGSTDHTEAVASKYPIKIIKQANQGVASARNAGIKLATGNYILPLDADDKIHPQFLERSVPILNANPKIGVVFTHREHFGLLASRAF